MNPASLVTAANAANASHCYNYNAFNYAAASAAAAAASTGAAAVGVGTGGTIDNQPVLANSHLVTEVSASNAMGSMHPLVPHHGQIIANIENNSHNYDRDWTLDDVSQISSFRPCPQGSGSMTPFHDSIHNVLEHSIDSGSNSINSSRHDLSTNPMHAPANISSISETGRTNDSSSYVYNTAMHTTTPPQMSKFSRGSRGSDGSGSGVFKPTTKQYSNSSMFLENRDNLNSEYPKINYRHSSVLASPDISDNLDKFLGKDLRRYSDTKLLASDTDILNPMIFNAPPLLHPKVHDNDFNQTTQSNRNSLVGETLAQSILEIGGLPKIVDLNFINSATQQHYVMDPYELNIPDYMLHQYNQKIANSSNHQRNYYQPPAIRQTLRRSLNTVEKAGDDSIKKSNADPQTERLIFKSLPNLSGSCESLIKK